MINTEFAPPTLGHNVVRSVFLLSWGKGGEGNFGGRGEGGNGWGEEEHWKFLTKISWNNSPLVYMIMKSSFLHWRLLRLLAVCFFFSRISKRSVVRGEDFLEEGFWTRQVFVSPHTLIHTAIFSPCRTPVVLRARCKNRWSEERSTTSSLATYLSD